MWIAHFAPAFALKALTPNVPLWVLALAGSIPDVAFMVNAMLGIESFRYDAKIQARGCFPYSNDYPYTHSLLGMAVLGAGVALYYGATTKRRVSPMDLVSIFAAGVSHYFLELPSHRKDITLTPSSPRPHGISTSLFDSPTALLIVELSLVALSFIPYIRSTQPRPGRASAPTQLQIIGGVFVFEQIQFCFLGAPTHETRWVHAPMFLGTLLSTVWGLKWLDAARQTRV